MSTTQALPPRRALLISFVIASGMFAYAAVLSTCRVAHADAPVVACFDNLCGMDSYCSCHESPSGRRCWSQADDCAVDLECCQGDATACKTQGSDACSSITVSTRNERDAAPDAGVVSRPPAHATAPVIALPDVTQQPLAFVEAVRALWSTSWGLAIAVGVVGLLELAALAGKKYPKVAYLAWLGRGRVSVVIGASTGVLSTAIAAFATGGWLAFLTSIGGGLLAFWHQAGTDPSKT